MPQLPGDPPIEIILRRSARARRISLRVSGVDGRVTLTIPPRAREIEAMAFARTRADWIRAAVARLPVVAPVALGGLVPVEGRDRRLTPGGGRGAARLAEDALILPGPPEQAARRAAAFLRALARDRLAAACDRHSAALGCGYRSLALRDTRSRWGSCTAQGGLMFNWRLVMAPPEVLDYVAAHEVAHLAEMNHSPAFWAVVRRLMPDYETPRGWLRAEGNRLHAVRFLP